MFDRHNTREHILHNTTLYNSEHFVQPLAVRLLKKCAICNTCKYVEIFGNCWPMLTSRVGKYVKLQLTEWMPSSLFCSRSAVLVAISTFDKHIQLYPFCYVRRASRKKSICTICRDILFRPLFSAATVCLKPTCKIFRQMGQGIKEEA